MKSDRDKTDKKSSKRPHPDNVDETQTLTEKKDEASRLETLPKDIFEKMALNLDVESLYSFASATLVSKKLNPALKSALSANSFWQKYAIRNPLSSIDDNNTKKKWLQKQYIKTKNNAALDYDYLWASVIDALRQGSYIFLEIANNEEVQKNLYDHIKTQYAIDSNRAAQKNFSNTILFWAIFLNRVEDVKLYLKAQVCLQISSEGIHHPINTPGSIIATKILFRSAVVSGYDQIIEILCRLGVYQPQETSGQEFAAVAVKYNRAKVLAILLAQGASTDHGLAGITLLMRAAALGFIDCARVLIENRAPINQQVESGATALRAAIVYGHTELAKYLLKNGANPNLILKKSKENALHHAIRARKNELAKHVVLYIDNLDAPSMGGITALHWATLIGLADVVELLIKLNANKKIANDMGSTALGVALNKQNMQIINILQPEKNVINDELAGHTLLTYAAKHNLTLLVDELINRQENVDTPNQYGMSPLCTAASYGHVETTLALLKHKASVNDINKINGATPLRYAVEEGHLEATRILLAAGADPNQPNYRGTTPLWMAAEKGNIPIIELLIQAGANVETKTIAFKKDLLETAENKPQTVIDKIENYFKTIGSDQAEISARMIANLMGNEEAESLLKNKLTLTTEQEPIKYRQKGLGG